MHPTKLLDMNCNCYCSFCASAGITGPHDHFLRESKAADAPVTCPKLKATECGHCGRKGHTARYCGELVAAKKQAREAARATKKSKFDSGEWMEPSAGPKEHPGFESPRMNRKKVSTPSAPSKLASRFAALDMETDEEPSKPVAPRNLGPTWAQVAQGIAAGSLVLAAECKEEDEEELPALDWGKTPGARWGDVSA